LKNIASQPAKRETETTERLPAVDVRSAQSGGQAGAAGRGGAAAHAGSGAGRRAGTPGPSKASAKQKADASASASGRLRVSAPPRPAVPNTPDAPAAEAGSSEQENRAAAPDETDGLGGGGPAAVERFVPVVPAEVERTEAEASAEIVYPEAPLRIEVSREQIDALTLPLADPARPIIGIWRQVGGDNAADFAEGNYTRAVLVFRTDGVVEVVRWFGPKGEIRLDSRFRYAVAADERLHILPVRKGPGGPRQPYTLPLGAGQSVRVEPPAAKLPVALTFERREERLVIGGKVYQRVSGD